MQNYYAVKIFANPSDENITDLLAAFLADIGYDTFEPDEKGLTAYIKEEDFDADELREILNDFPIDTEFQVQKDLIEGKDWNEEWEKNYFKPIVVEDKCVVHSSFHTDVPTAEYDIVIDPKMAFGTGHHATTYNMMRLILETDVKDKNILDMGTGSGILAILCSMRGAKDITAIDIDQAAVDNARENIRLNKVEFNILKGDAEILSQCGKVDIVLANINRNIVLNDLPKYVSLLKGDGKVMLSGFYNTDAPMVIEKAESLGLKLVDTKEKDNWVALKFRQI